MNALPEPVAFPGDRAGPSRTATLPPPAERGATIVPDKVVGRIAAEAGRVALRHCAAVPPDRGPGAAPSASAVGHAGSVRLHLSVDLPYPSDLARVCERVQHDVANRVAQLTGMRVAEVTLTIRRLVTAPGPGRRRVR